MITNDETKLMGTDYQEENTNPTKSAQVVDEQAEQGKTPWKKVALGGASGILLGAGALYAVNAFAGNGAEQGNNAAATKAAGANEAKVDDDLSFEEAFQSARAQVGPGGVFQWHGGVYGTYTEDEWNAMSAQEKADFAQSAQAGTRATGVHAEHVTVHHSDVEVAHGHEEAQPKAEPAARTEQPTQQDEEHVRPAAHVTKTETTENEPFIKDSEDVHVVGQTKYEGHEAVAVDLDGDGQPDVAIIDVNDNHRFDDADVLVFPDGTVTTRGELAQSLAEEGQTGEVDPNAGYQQTAYTHEEEPVEPTAEDPMEDPNLHQASYDDGLATDDPMMGVDGTEDMGMDVQSI